MRRLLAILPVLLLLAGCGGSDWSDEQEGVHKAMLEWSAAVTRQDTDAMWELVSPDVQDVYHRELTISVRPQVKLDKAALAPDALTSEADRSQIKARLAQLPENAETMTDQEYYGWKVKQQLTPEGADNLARLFSRENVESITIDGDKAVVVLKTGAETRYSWVRHDGHWKFDAKPSILRELENAREREKKTD